MLCSCCESQLKKCEKSLLYLVQMEQDAPPDDQDKTSQWEQIYQELLATFSGMLVADIVLFPFETILHRLYLQGTRVLTDNMDHGREVLGVQFKYSGFLDCIWQIFCDDGLSGFYRGLGTLILQYTCQLVGLKLLQYAFVKLTGNGQNGSRKRSNITNYSSRMLLF